MTTEYCKEYLNKLTNEKWSYFDQDVRYGNLFYLVFFSTNWIDSEKTIKILNDNSIVYSDKQYDSSNKIVNELYVTKEELIRYIRDKKINEILK